MRENKGKKKTKTEFTQAGGIVTRQLGGRRKGLPFS